MRFRPLALAVPFLLGWACTTVDPEDCWPNTSGGLGKSPVPAGAVAVGPSGSGDFLRPQASAERPNPCVMPEGPGRTGSAQCYGACLTDYEERAAVCGRKSDEERRPCQDEAYVGYKNCRAKCDFDATINWNKHCDEQAEACEDRCRKLKDKDERQRCWMACNEDSGRCRKKCKE